MLFVSADSLLFFQDAQEVASGTPGETGLFCLWMMLTHGSQNRNMLKTALKDSLQRQSYRVV